MAETPQTYDDETMYTVNFTRPVSAGSFRYLPRQTPRMTGAMLKKVIAENGGPEVVRYANPDA